MDGLLVVIVLSFLVIGGLILISNLFDFSGQSKSAAPAAGLSEADADTGEETRWRSVKITPGRKCCEYARILSGKVFLLSEAPPLPLVNCGESNCSCRYNQLDDRRSGDDRRNKPVAPGYDWSSGQSDRRRRGGRRAADLAV